ncbi:hypothetical protein Dtox_0098 [Desulfofarcimen acetoxidans DSM 771]|uniref:Uncharacterized protein n=1 Tax=Desulfofarcimen acetoxidans (strain ATCC 49208 / DSM 771 / KCTC 5769 / VKM B-1644 / 5575) TaxID=485916 RepID=C8W2Q5_DESAS|nr:hypothetical protein Dtox_0098 [Desulfofarcimen acetoxidans DSM 771]
MTGEKTLINIKQLSKKYRTNVSKLIQAWRRGHSDLEISRSYRINLTTLRQIKADIELTHRRIRLEKRKEKFSDFYSSPQHHIFLRPFM